MTSTLSTSTPTPTSTPSAASATGTQPTARRWSDPSTWRVVVSGGSSGLGRAVCTRLGAAGAAVVSLDRSPSTDVQTVAVDLADTAATTAATADAISRLGALDAIVCCAGIDSPGRLDELDATQWDRIVAVNLHGTAAVVRAALPALRASRGRVMTVASTLGHRAVADATAYCASKFGIVGFTRALSAECKGDVGVTLLTPGGMRTPFFDGRDEQYRPGPDAPLADPEAIADAVVWALGVPETVEVKELVVTAPAETSWP
jgi:NADP-dependent 3-hydroxy acid dehydrogenase YdfG